LNPGSLWGRGSSLFLGWLVKLAILKLGGLRWYRSLTPFFLGLIFGDYMMACIWIGVGLITGTGYRFLPVP